MTFAKEKMLVVPKTPFLVTFYPEFCCRNGIFSKDIRHITAESLIRQAGYGHPFSQT
jgi:hypothetical protein